MRQTGALFLIMLGASFLGPSADAQPEEQALAAILPQEIHAHMGFLSDDLLEGRRTGTRGYGLAAKYVAAQFEALGLAPAGAGGSYFQPVPLVQMTTVPPECSLAFLRNGRKTALQYGVDYYTGAVSQNADVTAPVVYVGFGVTAPELGYDDYAGLDVRGKIILTLTGAPSRFPHDQRAYYSDPLVGTRNAVAHGAAGILAIFSPELERIFPWESAFKEDSLPKVSWADETGRAHFVRPGIAVLSWKGARELFAGTSHSLEEVFKNAESGRPQSFELPVRVSLRTTGRTAAIESPNVAAVLRGSDPRLQEEYVVLSAHLDHVGVGEPVAGDSIYNGAYDNASGVAILLAVANAFSHLPVAPRRSVLFLAVTGEEEDLQGSDFFAHHPTVPIGRIVADVNLDMFLMLYPFRDVIAFGAEHSSLAQTVAEAARRLGIAVSPDPFPEQVMFIRSDHYSFVQQGVPAIFLTGGFQTGDPAIDGRALWEKWMQDVLHHPADDMRQTIHFDAGAQFAKLNFLISYLVAQNEKSPAWNPGDFFGATFGHARTSG